MPAALASREREREHTRRPVVVAWGLWLLALTANLLTYVFFVIPDPTRSPALETFDWATGWLPFMVFVTVGTVIVARRPKNVIGWLCCAIGVAASFSGFGSSDSARSIAADPDRIPGGLVLHLLGQVLYVVPLLGLLPVLVLVFPTGRLPSRRWRPVLWIVAVGLALYVTSVMLKPGPAGDGLPDNPLGVAAADQVLGPVAAASGLLFGVFLVLVVASLVIRFRRARGEERQQLKWLATGCFCSHWSARPSAGSSNRSPHRSWGRCTRRSCSRSSRPRSAWPS
jgi:two-component system, NarL family, sensor kinase